jgi:hypothetical protein
VSPLCYRKPCPCSTHVPRSLNSCSLRATREEETSLKPTTDPAHTGSPLLTDHEILLRQSEQVKENMAKGKTLLQTRKLVQLGMESQFVQAFLTLSFLLLQFSCFLSQFTLPLVFLLSFFS